MKELYKYKDRVLLYDTETKEVKELDKKTARKVLDSRAKMLDSRVRNSIVKDSHYLESNKQYMIKLWNRKDEFERKYKVTITRQGEGLYIEGSRKNLVLLLQELYGGDFNPNPFIYDSITKESVNDGRYDNYYGEEEANKYGAKIIQALRGKTITKRRDKSNQPGGLEYEAKKLGIDVWDFLRALEGLCYQGKAEETSDSTYRIKDSVEVEDAISYSQALENFKKNSVVYKGISYSQALENFKRFLKKYYGYTDEDLKKAKVELVYPLKSVKKMWYGFLNGRDESHFSYDGKKWGSIWDSNVRDSLTEDSSFDDLLRFGKEIKEISYKSDEQEIRSVFLKAETIARQVESSIRGLSAQYKTKLANLKKDPHNETVETEYYKVGNVVNSIKNTLIDCINFFNTSSGLGITRALFIRDTYGRIVGQRFEGKTDKYLSMAKKYHDRFLRLYQQLNTTLKDSITEDYENEDIEYIDKDKVSKSRAKDILEIYDDTLIIVTDEKNRVVYKGIVDYAPKEIRDGRWRKGANNKTFTINTERGVLTVKVLDSSVRDSVGVKDAISESQALENFKRFLKKYYGYTDEDLKKAKVELEKIDSPFNYKEVWYGSSDGKVASYYSLDGKKWDEI